MGTFILMSYFLFTFIQIIERHDDERFKTAQYEGILYVFSKRLDRHPSELIIFEKSRNNAPFRGCNVNLTNAGRHMKNRCFKGWIPGFSVWPCNKPRDNVQVKCNLVDWKSLCNSATHEIFHYLSLCIYRLQQRT